MNRAIPALLAITAPPALLAAHLAPSIACTEPGRRLFPALVRAPSADSVALTFDDGPDHTTGAFLDALDRADARATFFLVGEQVVRNPNCVAEIVAAGHEVGVHGYAHRNHLRTLPWEVREDLKRAQAVIEDAAGRPVRAFRPPFGLFSLASWVEARRRGWARVFWARWGMDWEAAATAESVAANIGTPASGDIILLHDSDRYSLPGRWRVTLAALPLILERTAAAGLAVRSLAELLEPDHPTDQERQPALVNGAQGLSLSRCRDERTKTCA